LRDLAVYAGKEIKQQGQNLSKTKLI